ncbi:MAG: c-type cytochrome domain-containing protein [Gallionella sp.]
MKTKILMGSIVLAISTFLVAAFPALAFGEVSYKNDIYPILHDYCLNCHQPGGKGYEKSGLDMRTYQSLMKGTNFGPVIHPGDSFSSVLIELVEGRAHPALKMPYQMNGGLAKDKIDLLKTWVQQGAKNN